VQSPANCFNQKQPASNPETMFFSIDRQWQNPLTPQKNLILKPHRIFSTILESYFSTQTRQTQRIALSLNQDLAQWLHNGARWLAQCQKTVLAESNLALALKLGFSPL
jgi:hypothetical protein